MNKYNEYKVVPRNQIRAVYSGHTLTLVDGTVIDGFPMGIRGTTEVIVDDCDEGNFEYTPFTLGLPGEPEPKPSYYRYMIKTHVPEDSPNQKSSFVHYTNDPNADMLIRWVSFAKGMPMMDRLS